MASSRRIITQARYILADVSANNNKHWVLRMYDDGELVTSWGRVGLGEQTKSLGHFPSQTRDSVFKARCREKEAKGYKALQVVATDGGATAASPSASAASALEAATRDILGAGAPAPTAAPAPSSAPDAAPLAPPPPADSALERLVKLLVQQNVHDVKLASGGQIQADESGLFRTPLGIVTAPALARARVLLSLMAPLVAAGAFGDPAWPALLSEYLQLVPRNVGLQRPSAARLFPTPAVLQRENQLLDSLAGSLQMLEARRVQAAAAAAAAAAAGSALAPPPPPRLFDVSLRLVAVGEEEDPAALSTAGALWHVEGANTPSDAAAAAAAAAAAGSQIFRNIRSLQYQTARKEHPASALRLKRVYHFAHNPMRAAFNRSVGGGAVGNVMRLWHGTRVGNLLSILRTGLVVPPATSSHVTGRMFGDGIYASQVSTKALNYSYGAAPGQWRSGSSGRGSKGSSSSGGEEEEEGTESYFALLLDVAMGRVHHPAKWGSNLPAADSDSTWARAKDVGLSNDEMIVYRSEQVNPRFLCEFKAKKYY